MQSIALFGCLFRCLLPIVFYCSLLFYMPLPRYYKMQFVLTRLATCHFTPVICLLNYKAWPRRFAWFIIKQWKFPIPRCGWRIGTYKLSVRLCRFHRLSIYLIIIRCLRLPLFYGHKLHKGILCECSAIGQLLQANSYKRDLYLTPCLFYCFCCFCCCF